MQAKQYSKWLSALAGISMLISSGLGLFYDSDGSRRVVTNLYGQSVELFGRGIYHNDTVFKVSLNRAGDILMLTVAVLLIFTLINAQRTHRLLRLGLLSSALYATTVTVMGVHYNRLFGLYIIQFSACLFALFFTYRMNKEELHLSEVQLKSPTKKTAYFLIIAGLSALVWLSYIIPTTLYGTPLEMIATYTTEPTFVLDLGVVLPISIYTAVQLQRHKPAAYLVAIALLTFYSTIGIVVALQTLLQLQMAIVVPLGQTIGLLSTFIVIGVIAASFNYRLIKDLS